MVSDSPDFTLDTPVLRQLHAYWADKCAGRPYPSRDDIDPLGLKFILGNLLLIEVGDEPEPRFRYRLFGSEIARQQGFDMTGKYTDQHPWPDFAARAREVYLGVLQTTRPSLIRRRGLIGEQVFDHQSLILPLGNDRIDMLLVGVVFSPATP
ncbi:PAS domain-containing protein [Ferrovibrio sp.]|uniref:PAS domain-containing protein n=1 Tax=Ferrovibrio sp. TaxID=1917215 RepID=UPI00311E1BF1